MRRRGRRKSRRGHVQVDHGCKGSSFRRHMKKKSEVPLQTKGTEQKKLTGQKKNGKIKQCRGDQRDSGKDRRNGWMSERVGGVEGKRGSEKICMRECGSMLSLCSVSVGYMSIDWLCCVLLAENVQKVQRCCVEGIVDML